EPLDEVLLSVFRAPHSYSGMDMVEINAHGGVLITRRILQLLLSKGAVLAEPGEFTRQAFLTGRIDLAQAEAVNDMITATSDAGARIAVQGIRGSVRRLLEPLIDDILNIIAQIEVNIDYPEYEDVEELTSETLLPEITRWIDRIGRILERATFGQQVKKGIDTVILGRPNAGKSSLLNALLEEDKAIVTDIPGTTRDVVEGRVILDGIQLNLLDTAGIRETEDTVEKLGVERSRKAAREADLVILVRDPLATDADLDLPELVEGKQLIEVWNKSDVAPREGLSISAKTGEIEPLLQEIRARFEQGLDTKEALLSSERQIGLLRRAQASMMNAQAVLQDGGLPDMAEIDIQEAHSCLKEILGEVHREDLLDALFSRFCLGK
ncbi:tRNA uridine-5-carboxymethylaminomethyl(34) synthesis GTPase MnmE, partial [Faecalibaculum rodentium]